MKTILKLLIISALLIIPQTVQAKAPEYIAEELLTTEQENEIVLESNDELFDTNNQTQEVEQVAENDNHKEEDDDSVLDNEELDFAIFKQLDKNNDNIIDEDTLLGKIIHSKITRTDIQSFLLKDELTYRYEKGPLHKIQLYGGYRGSVSGLFNSQYSTKYDNLTTNIGAYGVFKDKDYKFKLAFKPIPQEGLNIIDGLVADAYITNTKIPHHQIIAGYSRVQTGIEGGTSSFIIPFVSRSQIARNFGNARSMSVKVLGNYEYVDYNIAFGSSGRFVTSGFPGAEFTGWLNIKPFGSQDKKLGKLTIGGGFNGGHNGIDYGVGSIYVGYKHKKLWTNFEAAIADGYSGSNGISANKASGFAATAGWKFTPQLQLIGRIDQFDPNRDKPHDHQREYTIGLNWFIKGQALKIVLNYVFCQNQTRDDSHKIILATQVLL